MTADPEHYAPLRTRLFAVLIDSTILVIPALIVLGCWGIIYLNVAIYTAGDYAARIPYGYVELLLAAGALIMLGGVVITYMLAFRTSGGSPGMRVTGIALLDVNTGQTVGSGKLANRSALGLLFVLIMLASAIGAVTIGRPGNQLPLAVTALLVFVSYLLAAIHVRRQTLLDSICGTVLVVRQQQSGRVGTGEWSGPGR